MGVTKPVKILSDWSVRGHPDEADVSVGLVGNSGELFSSNLRDRSRDSDIGWLLNIYYWVGVIFGRAERRNEATRNG